jgi:EAL domain-containing protein (putative c-di-GMP-specific phosphodiesterase class I)
VSESSARLAAVVPQAEFRAALDAGQTLFHYQPIVRLASGQIRGVEALLRWAHPTGGLLYPDDFLPAIAHTPVIRQVTRHALAAACQTANEKPQWTVSVNISSRDAVRGDLVDDVRAALRSYQAEPEQLIVELTEHAVVQDLPKAIENLTLLRQLGVGVSLDDFGTGYSSLFYLRELPLTEVKIDRVFIERLEHSGDDAAIVHAVVKLARQVGLHVVAEGVETAGQARMLAGLGCDLAQGYLLGRPAPPAELQPIELTWRQQRTARPAASRARAAVDGKSRQLVHDLLKQGASLHTIAAALNRAGQRTAQDTRWTAASVAHAISELDSASS